jgi:hypothetical protein
MHLSLNFPLMLIAGEVGDKGEIGQPGLPAKLSSILDIEPDDYESKIPSLYDILLTVYLYLTELQNTDKLNKFQYQIKQPRSRPSNNLSRLNPFNIFVTIAFDPSPNPAPLSNEYSKDLYVVPYHQYID